MESVFPQAALLCNILIHRIRSNVRWYVLVKCCIEECNGTCVWESFNRCADYSEGCAIVSVDGYVQGLRNRNVTHKGAKSDNLSI